MHARKTVKRAFTLVEILIVVVILGILAAIVVPQFAKAADDARAGNIQTQLNTIQNAIELFRAREGVYPDIAGTGWNDLIGGQADPNGGFVPTAGETQYLKDIPRNPAHEDRATMFVIEAVGIGVDGSATAGWVFTGDPEFQIYASYFDEDPYSATPLEVTPGTP